MYLNAALLPDVLVSGRSSAVYVIQNVNSLKVYVGSSSRLKSRWGVHRRSLAKGCHHSQRLQRAWDCHGEEAFTFKVLELVPVHALEEVETFWISTLGATNPAKGYNSAPVGGSTRGTKRGPLSEEHRSKVGAANRGKKRTKEQRAALSAAMRGKKMPDSHREAVRTRMLGSKRSPLSTAHREAVSRAQKGKVISASHKLALSVAHKGRKHSEETKRKRSESLRAWWAKRKAALATA